MAIPPDIKIRLEQLRGEMAAKAEAQRRQQQAQANAERMSKQFAPGRAKGGSVLPKEQHDENLNRFLAESAIKQRMYTGTSKDKDFSKFNVPKNGAWFTPSTEVASSYAKENDSKDLKYDPDTRGYKEINTADRVLPVYLRATKPYQITADDVKRMNVGNYKKAQSQFFDSLRAMGHDSAVFEDGTTVILEGPHQIKSAIGNRGTYDLSNPDINKAKGGEVKTPSLDTMRLALNKHGMYSPLEKAAMAVPRSKGTPAEFMAEISKQPGFRKEEVADRKISLPEQKMTKDEFLTHLQSHASPKLEEKVYHEEDEDEGDQTQYSQYKMPGGSNYREMLLKTPTFPESKNLQIMELEANIRRMNPEDYPPGYVQNMIDGVAKLKAEKAAMGDAYQSSHWRDDPNVLAHIRLSDRYAGDTGQFVVTGTKNGKTQFLFQTGIKGTPEQAQEAAKRWEAQGYQTNINQVGGGKKLLHVEEIQSDWHQEGRKKGYANPQAREQLLEQIESAKQAHQDYLNQMKEKYGGDGLQYARNMTQEEKEEARRLAGESERIRQSAPVFSNQVPDAPFKKSWHELAMKHILNHAANNGYDGIVITPGQEQADRYDLSKQISSIAYNPEEKLLDAWDHNRRQVMRREITDESQLADYIGKEAANKLLQTQPVMGKHLLEGQDLKVGGEGMKGFYDKIVPDYLNKLGKPHGAQVQMHSMPIGKPKVTEDEVINSFPGGVTDAMRSGDVGAQQYIAQKMAEANKPNMVHYFPIPDSMRQQIKNEGLPQYKRGGTVKGLDHFFQSDNSLDHFFQE